MERVVLKELDLVCIVTVFQVCEECDSPDLLLRGNRICYMNHVVKRWYLGLISGFWKGVGFECEIEVRILCST
jgi:hypothetical protein